MIKKNWASTLVDRLASVSKKVLRRGAGRTAIRVPTPTYAYHNVRGQSATTTRIRIASGRSLSKWDVAITAASCHAGRDREAFRAFAARKYGRKTVDATYSAVA